jgi:hypothetical protein
MNLLDTIAFCNISRIKGKVFDNKNRKIPGVIMAVISLPAGFFLYGILDYSGSDGKVVTLIYAVTFIEGIRLAGPRKFNTSDKWNLVLKQK